MLEVRKIKNLESVEDNSQAAFRFKAGLRADIKRELIQHPHATTIQTYQDVIDIEAYFGYPTWREFECFIVESTSMGNFGENYDVQVGCIQWATSQANYHKIRLCVMTQAHGSIFKKYVFRFEIKRRKVREEIEWFEKDKSKNIKRKR